MNRPVQRLVVALSLVLPLALASCKKKGDAKTAAPATGAVPSAPAAPASLFDPAAIDAALTAPEAKDPLFALVRQDIPALAKDCQAAKKYLSSFTWCDAWKKLVEGKLKPVLSKVRADNPQAIAQATAIGLAGISFLKSASEWERYAGLQLVEHSLYGLSSYKLYGNRERMVRAVANLAKTGPSTDERRLAIRLLGNDGGTAYFHGGDFDARVLITVLDEDKDKGVRGEAAAYLDKCLERGKCPVAPELVKRLYAKEADADVRDRLAQLAGRLKMKAEVLDWCRKGLLDNTLYWGCLRAYGAVLEKSDFDGFLALAKQYRESPASKTGFRMCYVVELLWNGTRKAGFPKAAVQEFVLATLEEKETKTSRDGCVVDNALKGLFDAHGVAKDELLALKALVEKQHAAFKKELDGNKGRQDVLKRFDTALAKLEKLLPKDDKKP